MNIKLDGMEFECTVEEAIVLMKEKSRKLQDLPTLSIGNYKFPIHFDPNQPKGVITLVGRYNPDVTGDSVHNHG